MYIYMILFIALNVVNFIKESTTYIKGEPELTDPPELTVVARIQYYHKNVLLLNKRSFNFIAFLVLHLLIN